MDVKGKRLDFDGQGRKLMLQHVHLHKIIGLVAYSDSSNTTQLQFQVGDRNDFLWDKTIAEAYAGIRNVFHLGSHVRLLWWGDVKSHLLCTSEKWTFLCVIRLPNSQAQWTRNIWHLACCVGPWHLKDEQWHSERVQSGNGTRGLYSWDGFFSPSACLR